MASTLTASEEGQLRQTIEMFEVITQSQPDDYQSLEILKEAYSKLGEEDKALATSRQIAGLYVQMGQYSSAIMEYESILQRYPDDPEVRAALAEIESKATGLGGDAGELPEETAGTLEESHGIETPRTGHRPGQGDQGRDGMFKVFVESSILTPTDFDIYWESSQAPSSQESFIDCLANRGILPVDDSLKLLSEKSRTAYLPLELYDLDVEFLRRFPRDLCRHWRVLPFDRMSKAFLVATSNPFNQQAATELQSIWSGRLIWYLSHPREIDNMLRKIFH